MTTSNSYDFSLSRDNIIDLAHQHIGAIGEGETANSSQVTEASKLLNMIIKLREADGMPLWALKRGTLLPVTGVSSIATDSHAVTTYRYTTASVAAAAGASTIVVASATGISNGDVIGIEEAASMQWTTVNGAPAGTTVTLTATLTAAVAAGADIYVYTASSDRIQKPLRLIEANVLSIVNNTSWELQIEDRADYFVLGNRTTTGTPVLIYYDLVSTSNTNLDNGQFFVYPRFLNGDVVIEFTYHRPFQDFDASTDTPDFPQAFYLPIMVELASMLAPKFGVSLEERKQLLMEAKLYRDDALSTIYPEGSYQIEPNWSRAD